MPPNNEDQENTINRKVVVVGRYFCEAESDYKPGIHIANISLTKADVNADRLFWLAKIDAVEKRGFSDAPGSMTCFSEEDFAAIRGFCTEFQLTDNQEDYPGRIKKTGVNLYTVKWENQFDASSEREAAEKALELFKDPGESVVFTVQSFDDQSNAPVLVDLFESFEEEDRPAL